MAKSKQTKRYEALDRLKKDLDYLLGKLRELSNIIASPRNTVSATERDSARESLKLCHVQVAAVEESISHLLKKIESDIGRDR